jgi:hypothetical protein
MAAVAIQLQGRKLPLDCFASLAMTAEVSLYACRLRGRRAVFAPFASGAHQLGPHWPERRKCGPRRFLSFL